MSIRVLTAVATVTSLVGFVAQAQDDALVQETRCWFNSNSFTAGAAIPAGSGIMVCTDDGSWVDAAQGAVSSSCIYEDKLYGIGSVVSVKDGPVLLCNADGAWKK